eukprot:m.8242 g.8242  ORF g.8242 m.8242 type:complete len:68 (+) comp9114_c0_seq1:45-248(+)
MTAAWRAAGMNYLQFSSMAARLVRSALKDASKAAAAKRAGGAINVRAYDNGQLVSAKSIQDALAKVM